MHLHLQAKLQSQLGPNLAVVCSGVDVDPDILWPEEQRAIAQAIPRRQREFAAGRAAARQAMQQLGWPACPVPANSDRSPCWPAGLIGSLSHSSTACVVVLGRNEHWRSVGIDIETCSGIEPSLWDSICSSTELQWLFAQPEQERALQVSRIFTAKEAFYKSRQPEEQTKLEFRSATTVWNRIDKILQEFRITTQEASNEWQFGYSIIYEGSVISWIVEIADIYQEKKTTLRTILSGHELL